MIVIVLVGAFIGAALATSAVVGLLFGLIAKRSDRASIVLVAAVGPSLLTALCGAGISYLAIQADAGGAFFFGIALALIGLLAVVPGTLAGHFVARRLRPNGDSR